MNAQDWWKTQYIEFRSTEFNYTRVSVRTEMYETAREAALERKLAAQQREIEALRERVKELEGYIDAHNKRVLDALLED